jgi:hypothetical protein
LRYRAIEADALGGPGLVAGLVLEHALDELALIARVPFARR